jgi:hypothetical protein
VKKVNRRGEGNACSLRRIDKRKFLQAMLSLQEFNCPFFGFKHISDFCPNLSNHKGPIRMFVK